MEDKMVFELSDDMMYGIEKYLSGKHVSKIFILSFSANKVVFQWRDNCNVHTNCIIWYNSSVNLWKVKETKIITLP